MPRELRLPFDPIERAGENWERTWGPSTAMRAATSVFRAQQILLARFDEALRPYELTFARYEALVLLRFSRTGTLPMKVIGGRLMVHPTSVTNTVERLAAAGLVDRRPNPDDGRGVLASITETGRDIVERATADLVAVDFGLENISDGRLDDLYATLRDVRYAAGDVAGAQALSNPPR
ncbi:MAG: MarR family transcriptional regulator [Geodermatophilaceae bacterium]|nr:MarR family transcriptional regulator [Geodermatophilaceae bacterium]MDQ3477048.1 MarR family transcriptional regulator [Actinomycetota bacterium]